MAGRNMDLQVIVRLRDLLSGPLRALQRSLEGIANMARRIGVVGTAIAAISFMGPIKEAAAFQQQLLDIAGTANLSGQAAFNMVEQSKRQYEQLALQIGQYSDTVAKGAGQMIAAGVDTKLVDQSIGIIGRSATAANAEFSDMAGVATSLLTTLRVPADKLEGAMAGLVVAGKEGAFELKDMARYFPTLTGQMIKFGVTGREAVNFLSSALQIARKGTADPAEAANNLKNFLAKVLAPATIKNFEKAGVDIEAVMKDAAVKGINPIEAVIQKIVKLTGVSGKEIEGLMKKAKQNGQTDAEALATVREQLQKIYGASQLGELFGDMQVMDFLIPMLANIEEYKRIKEEVAKATGAIVDRDFDTQMEGLNRQLIRFNEIGTQAVREVGFAFGSWLPLINSGLETLLKWVRELDASTGGMVRQALSFAGAAIVVAGALGALGIILPIVAAGFGAIASLIGPVGIALAAIATAGYIIYRNWATVGPRLAAIWDGIKSSVTAFAASAMNVGRRMIAAGQELADRYGPIILDGIGRAWRSASSAAVSAWATISDVGGKVLAAGQELADRYGPILRDGMTAALDDVLAGWDNLKKLMSGFAEGLKFEVDLSGLTVDDAKLAAFRALDTAIAGIGAGWQALKDFGSGFAPYLEGIGKDAGGTINSIVRIGDAFVRLAEALGKIIGFDQGTVTGFFKGLGDLAGGSLGLAVNLIGELAKVLASVAEGIASVAEAVANGIDWSNLLPKGVTDAWNSLAGSIKSVMDLLPASQNIRQGKYDRSAVANQNQTGASNWWTNLLGNGPVERPADPVTRPEPVVTLPANDNAGVDPVTTKSVRPALAAPQGRETVRVENDLKVGGAVTVKVDGPGTVTSTATDNSAVPIVTNTGRVIGRF